MAFRRFYFEPIKTGSPTSKVTAIENEHVQIGNRRVPGSVPLQNRATGEIWSGIGQFSDQADIGRHVRFFGYPRRKGIAACDQKTKGHPSQYKRRPSRTRGGRRTECTRID